MSDALDLPKPRPVEPRDEPCNVQLVTRVTPDSREAIKALAVSQGITVQQLGLYAWSLALKAYGLSPLPEATGSK
jgi:hypothetical protein